MFFAIRRTILVGIYLLLAAIGYYLWTQRERLDPIVIWVKAWQGRDERAVDTLASLTGQVVRVDGMDRIQLAGANGQMWNVGATGLMPRKDRNPKARVEAERKCREYLQSVLLSNQVRVELTYTNGRNALGLVYVGETNVNAELIKSGMARLQPQYIRFLPVNKQYPLLIADHQARERTTVIAQAPVK
jgi:endonuclease YncB( thermonuclease family)